MATRVWRIVLLTIWALNCAGALAEQFGGYGSGDQGFLALGTSTPFVYEVRVRPDSAEYRAGLRTGDRLDMRDLSLGERTAIKVSDGGPVGMHVRLPVQRGSEHLVINYVIPPRPATPLDALDFVVECLMLLAALILAWRGAGSIPGRLLAGVLLNWTFPFEDFAAPDPIINTAIAVIAKVVFALGVVLLALYFGCFGRRTTARTAIAVLTYSAIGAIGVGLFLRYAGVVTLWYDAGGWWIDQNVVLGWLRSASDVLPVVYGAITLTTVKPSDFSRVAWILAAASTSLLDVAWITVFFMGPGATNITDVIGSISSVIGAAIVVYGMLTRRVLDIGFALNRAAVFTGVSIIVVGAFVLIEWAATEWLSQASRTTNALVGAGIALCLGLSARFIHARVDRAIDTVFFRKRHEDEASLRAFARQALYISRADTLLERTAEVLKAHAGASRVAFWFDDGTGLQVDQDDPALLALRAGERLVFLRDAGSALPGHIAYPLLARGRVTGALILTSEDSDHSYAPDEIDAVEAVAHSVGIALDTLRERSDVDALGPLLEELRRFLAGQRAEFTS